jgi:hypothetical protein
MKSASLFPNLFLKKRATNEIQKELAFTQYSRKQSQYLKLEASLQKQFSALNEITFERDTKF